MSEKVKFFQEISEKYVVKYARKRIWYLIKSKPV